jgi:hypothetical protein
VALLNLKPRPSQQYSSLSCPVPLMPCIPLTLYNFFICRQIFLLRWLRRFVPLPLFTTIHLPTGPSSSDGYFSRCTFPKRYESIASGSAAVCLWQDALGMALPGVAERSAAVLSRVARDCRIQKAACDYMLSGLRCGGSQGGQRVLDAGVSSFVGEINA